LHKKRRAGEKKKFKKNGNCPTGTGVDPPAAGQHLRLWDSSNFFEILKFKNKEFLEVWVMGQGF
jgi:hypothetical protein